MSHIDEITEELLLDVRIIVMAKTGEDEEHVEDVLQTVLEETLPRIDDVRNLMGWLITSTVNRLHNKRRDDACLVFTREIEKYPDERQHLGGSFEGEKNSEILLALSEGHSEREVAEFFDITRHFVHKVRMDWANDQMNV